MSAEGEEDMSSYSEGQVHQLVDRLEKVGFTPADLTRLGQFPNLDWVRAVVNGQAKIIPVSGDATRWVTLSPTAIAVDLAATPNLPFAGAEVEAHSGEGWAIVEKRADGQLYVNGRKTILHLSKRQMGGRTLKGYELREELTGKPVLNANVLDALYDNPHLIPEDWKNDEQGNTRYIFFWGTIYRSAGGRLYVRGLCFRGGMWATGGWLDGDWGDCCYPAALLASS
jgi:hypothetical protein